MSDNLKNQFISYLRANFNDPSNWTANRDASGWYYYKNEFYPKDGDGPIPQIVLLNGFTIPVDLDNDYQNASAELTITFEAIQSANNSKAGEFPTASNFK